MATNSKGDRQALNMQMSVRTVQLKLINAGHTPGAAHKAAVAALARYHPTLRPEPTVSALHGSHVEVRRAVVAVAKASKAGKRIHGRRVR